VFTYLMNCFKYLLVSSLLLIGQLPTLSTLFLSFSLSYQMFHCLCAVFTWALWTSVIFNRRKYDRIFPWPDIIVVTFGLKVKFTASLLSTLGKKSLVIAPFVVFSH
jgi:hypothetical protein